MMNDLSWMIYAADVVSGAAGLAGALSFLSGATAAVGVFVWCLLGASPAIYSWDDKDVRLAKIAAHDAIRSASTKYTKPLLASALACAVIATILPGRDTIYAIAASEMGEKALSTQTGGKAVKALNVWLDRQIEGDEK